MRLVLPLLCLSTLSLSPELSAQTSAQDSIARSYAISEVVVTGTQTPRLLKKLPIMTQVISHKDLERVQPRSAADALQMTIPGVNVTVHGAQYRVSIQGMTGDYILFLIDGEKITSEGNGVVDLNRIDMTTIERIEIVRGAASALYGSNAIGGVVNFITKKAGKRLQATAGLDYSSEGQTRYTASLQARYKGLYSSTSLGYTDLKGYTIPTRSGATDQLAQNAVMGSKTQYFGQSLRYRPEGDRLELSAFVRYSFRDQEQDGATRNHYRTHNIGGKGYYSFSDRSSLSLDYNNELYDRSYWYTYVGSKSPVFLFHAHTARLQYNYGKEGSTPILANIGGELYAEDLKGNRISEDGATRRAALYSLYAQGEWHATEHCSVVGGLRYDSHGRFGGHLSPRLSVLYSIDRMRLRASYSEGFRSPSIKELFMSWDHLGMFFIKGNDELRPETSRMLSLSSEWQTQQLNLTLIASYNEIKNRISMVEEDGGNTQRYRNTSTKAQLLNLQASLRWRLPLGFHFAGDYVWLRDLDRVMSKSGRSLPFASTRPHNFTSTLGWEHRLGRYALSASYTLRGSSSVETAQYNTDLKDYLAVRHEGFTLSRIHAGIAWRDHIRLGAGIDNLFDYHPETLNVTGSTSPGRSYYLSLGLSL